MFEQELDNLLQKPWSDEEKILISRLMDNVAYYKKLIPKSLKQDILNALQMCNVLKTELETYRETCKCNCFIEKLTTDINQDTCECKCNPCECNPCNCEKTTESVEEKKCKCDPCKCDPCNC